jgi:eukaryotic-like serine/threonine-protein kinase
LAVTDVTASALADALRDRYTLERELGRGGMASVYLARDLKHDRLVALKVLHPELAHALGPERFLREIRTTGRLQHTHILPVHDSGEAEGLLWYTMPYVEGESLRGRLTRERQLPLDDALRITLAVADALSYAHQQGIIHRDVKPENLLLSGERCLVADFGIAKALDAAGGEKLTDTGLALGTPQYMSPEQASGDNHLDGRSDLYSLGCVLYEMLAGTPPFTGPTVQAILARHSIDPVPRLRTVRATVPEAVEHVITKALAKVPADRFPTVAQFSQALSSAAEGPLPLESGRRFGRRSLAAAALLLAMSLGLLWLLLRPHRPPTGGPADSRVVAVLPFRATGADPALRYLREGMVDLLAIKLTGEGGPRAVDPRAALSAWRRGGGSPTRDPSPDAALEIAHALGAGRLIDGGIVGTTRHVTLTASVLEVPGGRVRARASVEGPPDNLPALVDRLTAELLAGEAGRTELASVTSLPALRAYFDGQRAYRLGKVADAMKAFNQALRADSTFALAAIGLFAASQWLLDKFYPPGTDIERAVAIAWTNRNRLSARDRAVLLGYFGPRYPKPSSLTDFIAAREEAVAAAPDNPDLWYLLGDEIFHFGALLGMDSSLSRAAQAFRRSLALDSAGAVFPTFAEPLQHLIEIAAIEGDTGMMRRLATTALAADSTAVEAGFFRWVLATASHDSIALVSARSRFTQMDAMSLINLVNSSQEMGTGWADAQAGIAALRAAAPTRAQRAGSSILAHVLALNRGRPKEAVTALQEMLENKVRERLHWRVVDALNWDGDSAAGAQAARELGPYANSAGAGTTSDREVRSRDLCVQQQWRLAHGDSTATRAAIRRLQDSYQVCAAVLEAWLATIGPRSHAARSLDRLDSLLLTGMSFGEASTLPANIIAARLHEAMGDSRAALAAIRRRAYGFQPQYLSTYLREEGRLAALTGDTTGAIAAYRHYLRLRSDPEPSIRPEVERVRGELAALVVEPK